MAAKKKAVKKVKEVSDQEKAAIHIFKTLMPNWEGAMMIFQFETKKGRRRVVIGGENVYNLILKAVKKAKI
jgi:hypothetical protein